MATEVQSGRTETYALSLKPAGYLNVLIPPDATVLSAKVLGAPSTIAWKYLGVFTLRSYQFAQIGVDDYTPHWPRSSQTAPLSVMIQVSRNTRQYAAASADQLSDTVIKRLSQSSVSGTALPGLSFGNVERANEWRGSPILPVNKIQSYQLTQSNVGYVIITSGNLQSLLSNYVNWKQTQGMLPFLITMETIMAVYAGDTVQSRTMEFLKDAYNTWHMEYVLFVGGKDTVPPIKYQRTSLEVSGQMLDLTTDYYYATLEQPTNSYTQTHYRALDICEPGAVCVTTLNTEYPVDFPDFILGRLPSDNPTEIANMLAKTISYEQNQNPGDWVKNSLLVAGAVSGTTSWPVSSWEQYARGPRTQLRYPQNLTVNALVQAINLGVGSVILYTHGDESEWWLGGQETLGYDNVGLLSNTRLPVIFTEGCFTGKWDTSRSVAVKLLAMQNTGAVAIISGMWYGPQGLEVYYSAYNDYPDYVPNSNYNIGKAFFYLTSLDGVIEYMNVLGDPSLVLAISRYPLINAHEFRNVVSILPVVVASAMFQRGYTLTSTRISSIL